MTRKQIFLAVSMLVVVPTISVLAQRPSDGLPIPEEAAQAKALDLIREVYAADYAAAKTSDKKADLARKMIQKATESKDDPASCFVLLRVARDLAVQAGQADVAFQAIDALLRSYQIDAHAMKVDALTNAAKLASKPEQHEIIAQLAQQIMEEAVASDNFGEASQLGEMALASARESKKRELQKQIAERNREITELSQAYAEVIPAMAKLEQTPIDPEANLAVGKYLCLIKGNWDKGISMLALGTDEALKALAIKELGEVVDSQAQVTLGDGWWKLAEKEKDTAQKQLEGRAAYWYRQALSGLTGLVKDKVERRLREISEEPSSTAHTHTAPHSKRPVTGAPLPSFMAKPRYQTYIFTDERIVKRDWELLGNWRIEAVGVRLYGGAGHKSPGEPGAVALLRSRSAFKGDLSVEIAYQMSPNCEIWMHAWNQQFEFKETGKAIARLVRKGDTVTFSSGNQPPTTVKLREENLDSETPIAFHLDRRNLYRPRMELLVLGITIGSQTRR